MNAASALDLKNTVFELAKVPASNTENDGKSLTSILLKNEKTIENRPYFYYGLGNRLFAMRLGEWKIHVQTYSQTQRKYFEDEMPLLFNLNEDPSETQNLAQKHPKLVKDLLALIDQHQKEIKAAGTFYE